MKTLKQIPVPVAVVIMVLCIVLGVVFGNNNALSRASKEPEAILAEVSVTASQRATSAKNLLVVAKRNTVDAKAINALEDAIAGLESAKKANKISSANTTLTFTAEAVNEQIQASATDQDKRLATGVLDDMASYERILSRQANSYNEALGDVRSVYKTLPFGWLVGGMPEVYQ